MTNYRLKVLNEGNEYIGYVINNDEIVYTTPPQTSPNVASSLLTKYINELGTSPVQITKTVPTGTPSQTVTSVPNPAPAVVRSSGGCNCRRG